MSAVCSCAVDPDAHPDDITHFPGCLYPANQRTMTNENWLELYNGDEPAPEPPEPEPEPEPEEPTTPPIHRQVYEPLQPRRGFSRQYRVRWQRAGRQPRSKTFARFGDAVRLARRLEVEETNPGRVWNTRKGMRVTKPIVEWIALDMAYVLQATEGKMRPCECNCGETFYPARSDQRYVDGAHRLRAFRARGPRPDPVPVTASVGKSRFRNGYRGVKAVTTWSRPAKAVTAVPVTKPPSDQGM